MTDKTQIVTPDGPRDLKPFKKESKWHAFTLRRVVFTQAEVGAAVASAVHGFAAFLATAASPNGTIQREKLQSYATEFLASPQEEKK